MQICRRDGQKMRRKLLLIFVGLWLMIYEVFEYIALELQSPENAIGQLDRLEEQILSLDTMPERYRKYEKEPWKSKGIY